jgi:Cu(I)/Ag(I) efflux system periplasmic protein CusF
MKIVIATTLLALAGLLPQAALAADPHAGHMAMAGNAASEAPLADGTVKKVDRAAGKVTIAHGPLVNLAMPAMTMAFRVKEAAWLDQMKADDKIRFLAESVNGSLTVVRFEMAK